MSSSISYKQQYVSMSNQRFNRLLEFAIQTGYDTCKDDEERRFTIRLQHLDEHEFFNGYALQIEDVFPDIEERKFWARCLFDVAHLIFTRKLGLHDVEFWQASTIGDAYLFARMLTRSVQEEELAWHPDTMATIEAEAFYNGGVDVVL